MNNTEGVKHFFTACICMFGLSVWHSFPLLNSSTTFPQVNMVSSVWRTWFTRSTWLVKASGLPTTSCCRSSCQWLVTLPRIRLGFWRTWEILDFAIQTLMLSSDNSTEGPMQDGHSAESIRMLLFLTTQMPTKQDIKKCVWFVDLTEKLMYFTQSPISYKYICMAFFLVPSWETSQGNTSQTGLAYHGQSICQK